jgi:hypothetical protein
MTTPIQTPAPTLNPINEWEKTFYYLVDSNCDGRAVLGEDQIVRIQLNENLSNEDAKYQMTVQCFASDGSGEIGDPIAKEFVPSVAQKQKQEAIFSGLLENGADTHNENTTAVCAKLCSVFYDGSLFIADAPTEQDPASGKVTPVLVDFEDLIDYYPELFGQGSWQKADEVVYGQR